MEHIAFSRLAQGHSDCLHKEGCCFAVTGIGLPASSRRPGGGSADAKPHGGDFQKTSEAVFRRFRLFEVRARTAKTTLGNAWRASQVEKRLPILRN
jgi:hypothetical protein